MRKAVVATAIGLGAMVSPSLVLAQETTPPTSVDVDVSVDVDKVTNPDRDNDRNDNDDDDGDAGLWGLLGLLGLIGLAGLAGLKRRDTGYASGARISGDTTPRGSTSTDR